MAEVICVVPVAPIRSEGSHRAEMVSQILLGETATVLNETKDFFQVQMHQDGYEGWCQKLQLQILPEGATIVTKGYTSNWVSSAVLNGQPIQLPLGTPIVSFAQANFEISYADAVLDPINNTFNPAALEIVAKQFLGTAYLWGGRTVFGIDCSGFVRHLYEKSVGQLLPRRAVDQARATEVIDRDELKPGDLVFFNTMRRPFSHVGIYIGDGKFIHAPRPGKSVRVDDMREAYWQKRFNGARRVQSDKLHAEPTTN